MFTVSYKTIQHKSVTKKKRKKIENKQSKKSVLSKHKLKKWCADGNEPVQHTPHAPGISEDKKFPEEGGESVRVGFHKPLAGTHNRVRFGAVRVSA